MQATGYAGGHDFSDKSDRSNGIIFFPYLLLDTSDNVANRTMKSPAGMKRSEHLSGELISCVPGKARLLNGDTWNNDTYFR